MDSSTRPLRPRRSVHSTATTTAAGTATCSAAASNTPRFYDHVADPVGAARDGGLGTASETIAVEVRRPGGPVQRLPAADPRPRSPPTAIHLSGIFISATHDESAPDSLGLGGVSQTTSGVNDYWVNYMVQQSAQAIERAYRAMRPARIRYTEVLEPANVRQCWSSYPFVDDQHIPVLQAVDAARAARSSRWRASASTPRRSASTAARRRSTRRTTGSPPTGSTSSAPRCSSSSAASRSRWPGSVGSVESPEVYSQRDLPHAAGVRRRQPPRRLPHAVQGRQRDRRGRHRCTSRSATTARRKAFGDDMAGPIVQALRAGAYHYSRTEPDLGRSARTSACRSRTSCSCSARRARRVRAAARLQRRLHEGLAGARQRLARRARRCSSQVAAFQIGDGEFISVPGEVFPFTFLRGFLGPQDMPTPSAPLPPWLLPAHARAVPVHRRARRGHARLHLPERQRGRDPDRDRTSNPSDTDRFGCGHSDDSESTSAQTRRTSSATRSCGCWTRHGGGRRRSSRGRYVLPGGHAVPRSARRPGDQVQRRSDVPPRRRAASAVELASRQGRASDGLDVAERPARSARPTATRAATSTPTGRACLARRVPGRKIGKPAPSGVYTIRPRAAGRV